MDATQALLRAVWPAAQAAAADERAAVQAAGEAIARAGAVLRPADLVVADAILAAVTESPAAAWAALPVPDRQALALARLTALSTRQIAFVLDIEEAEVRARLTRALRAMAPSAAGIAA